MKKRITLTSDDLKNIIKEAITEFVTLNEGVDIDRLNKVVSFNSSHQDNVDTNDYIRPYIIKNNARNETVLSIFERKDNDDRIDGNPLVYALKGLHNWRFANPKSDIFSLLRRFVSVTKNLHNNFDTLIITPSNNQLNNIIFSYLVRLINFNYKIERLFTKMSANEVYEFYLDEDYLEGLATDEISLRRIRKEVDEAFSRMNKENNGIFSYKYLRNLVYRDAITQSLGVSSAESSLDDSRNAINGKDVLVFDDTVASGKTLSDSASAIREVFDPKSITFLTLFSPRENNENGTNNVRTYL